MAASERTGVAPQNPEAEDNVLGACMLSPAAADKALSILAPEQFYLLGNGCLFTAIGSLRLQGKDVEPLLLVAELEAKGDLERVGGRMRVKELAALAVAASNVGHYADLVRDAWVKRELLGVLSPALESARNGRSSDEALDEAERAMVNLQSRIERGKTMVVSGFQAAQHYQAKMDSPPGKERGISAPFPRAFRGFFPGRLYLLGGYAKDGKSALAVQCLRRACEDGQRVGFASIEMSWQDLTDRIVASFGVPYAMAQSGQVTSVYRPSAEKAIAELARWNVEIIDNEALDPAALVRYQQMRRFDFLIVDHLHRMDWKERRDIERNIRAITNLARRYDIPVLCLVQLHRPHGRDDFPRPTMHSIRETGMAEMEASLVAFIYRQRDENNMPTKEAELIVAANRYGKTGRFDLQFREEEVRFVEVEPA